MGLPLRLGCPLKDAVVDKTEQLVKEASAPQSCKGDRNSSQTRAVFGSRAWSFESVIDDLIVETS